MTEEKKPVAPMPPELMYQERAALLEVRKLIMRKPDAVIAFLVGNNQPPSRALIALALSAQLEEAKRHHESLKVTTALCRYLNLDKSTSNNVEDKDGQDETPGG